MSRVLRKEGASVALIALATVALAAGPAEAQRLAKEPRAPASVCAEPRVEISPAPGGRSRIAVDSSCRAAELVTFTYAEAVFMQWLDARGRAEFVLDPFAGDDESVNIRFEDRTEVVRRPAVGDGMRDFSKVAIVWTSAVDLDLHAFEGQATFGGPGHVWSGRPGTIEEAMANAQRNERGHGFLSTVGAGGEMGMNLEVYTLVHASAEEGGLVKLAIDYKSRGSRPEGPFCGNGHLARLTFKAYILDRGRPLRKLDLAFAAVPCGTEIGPGARLNSRLIPDLVIRR
jgi:hypothetical protein